MSSEWADWASFEGRLPGFIEWAEPPPVALDEERYAILRTGCPGLRWARVSPNPIVETLVSSGGFYDTDDPSDHPEGAIAWARASAIQHKLRIAKLVKGGAP